MKQGDVVVRKSYGGDILFRIEELRPLRAILKGIDYRLVADAPIGDLQHVRDTRTHASHSRAEAKLQQSIESVEAYKRWQIRKLLAAYGYQGREEMYFEMPGKVLHLDGDAAYLRKSMQLYGLFRVPAEGYCVPESGMSGALERFLPQSNPDIVVITGHDSVLKKFNGVDLSQLENYKNSVHFVDAVKTARTFDRSRDNLIVIAGACQSHFESLLHAGANVASSPARILIHALDPVNVAIKVAFTSTHDRIDIREVFENTVSGLEGIGGLDTRGAYRLGMPRLRMNEGN